MKRGLTGALLLVRVANASAQAEEANDRDRWTHSLSVQAQTGLETPIGDIGVRAEFAVFSWLSLEAGAGYARSILPDAGVQFAGGPRVRLPIAGFGLSSGISFSGGPYFWCDSCLFEQGQERKWDVAYWLNVDATLEFRWATGLIVGAFAGYSRMLNPDSYACTPAPSMSQCGGFPGVSTTPFGGIRVGYWFRPLD